MNIKTNLENILEWGQNTICLDNIEWELYNVWMGIISEEYHKVYTPKPHEFVDFSHQLMVTFDGEVLGLIPCTGTKLIRKDGSINEFVDERTSYQS